MFYQFNKDDTVGLTDVRHSWLCLIIVALLVISQVFVDKFYGRGWGLAAAVLALPLWLIIRPWQFGLLSAKSRRKIRVQGAGFFIVLILVVLLAYYRF
jgi:hypothetical protein